MLCRVNQGGVHRHPRPVDCEELWSQDARELQAASIAGPPFCLPSFSSSHNLCQTQCLSLSFCVSVCVSVCIGCWSMLFQTSAWIMHAPPPFVDLICGLATLNKVQQGHCLHRSDLRYTFSPWMYCCAEPGKMPGL